MDGTPILDIKPYVPTTSTPTRFGFTTANQRHRLQVEIPDDLLAGIPTDKGTPFAGCCRGPRPAYQDDPGRLYGSASPA